MTERPTRAPRRRRTRSRVRMVLGIIMLLIVLLVGSAAAVGWNLFYRADASVESGRAVQIEVAKGSSTAAIAKQLSSTGVVRNANMFRLSARNAEADGLLKHGVYDLQTGMDYDRVIELLTAGPDVEYTSVTIPEGWVIDQIAARFDEQAGIPADEFVALAANATDFADDHPYLAEAYSNSLEGYLFPKTYRVREGATARDVVSMMLQQFDREIATVDMTPAEVRGLSLNDVVILASIIERETKVASERPVVASVIYNRLAKNMRLEIDATIEYVLQTNRLRLRNSDLEVDSPYNTYRNAGLTPGPISSPGLASIEAAVYPADTDYIYYVLTDPDGSHTFTETWEDFLVAKRKSKEVFGQ